ncbi:MAG: GAF domain-containing sensor histidine kinase [Myxococcaceae bacterium]|jgi:signal transduction histidine kinase|nr:GAF domain-containing sensor histidine kinase [Myxococcaceae bacterium]
MTDRSKAPRTDPGALVSGLAQKLTELEAAVARQSERLSAIIEVGSQLSAARDVDALLRTVMDRLAALLEAEAATLFMHDVKTNELWSRVLKGSAMRELRLEARRAGIAGHVFRTGKTVRIGDAYEDARFNPEIDRQSGFKTRSIVAAPLRHVSGKVLGVVEVLHRRPDAFTEEDERLVEGVATQIAAVLDNVLLLEELAQRVRDLDLLYGLERAAASSDAKTDLLERILSTAIDAVDARAGSILIAEESKDSLYFRNSRGEKAEALTSMRLKAGQGIAGYVASTGDIVRVDRADDSPHYDKSVARKLGVSIGAVLCVPIPGEEGLLGSLELLNKKGGFTDADERLVVLVAGQIGRAIASRQSREEQERRVRMAAIGQMLAGVLHDLRTPLTVIAGYAEMMAEEPSEDGRREMAKSILSQLDHVAAMQKETLAFARGEKSVLLRRVYVHVFMKELEEQLEREFERSRVELRVVTGYTGAARFDENKMKRVILNLARNALDAMPDDGRFTLSVDREADEIVFRATDTGPGIPDVIADKLFESFVSAGKKNGTGLGLAIVKKIVEEHGGDVTFKTRPGRGTTFEVRFPAGVEAD